MILEIDNKINGLFNETESIDETDDFEFDYKIPELQYSHTLSNSSWDLDIIEKFAKKFFPIKIKCPSFPPLQLRFSPNLILTAGLIVEYEEDINFSSSRLSYDLYGGLDLGAKIELGLYFDIVIAELDIAVGLKGNIYRGRVGFKLSIDFTEVKSYIFFYYYNLGASLDFYIYIKTKILFFETKLLDYSYSIYQASSYEENKKEYLLYDDSDRSYYLL
jgi:hypothetical protein